MIEVKEALSAFESYNNIKLDNYVSDEYIYNPNEGPLFLDNYIGKDIFEKHITEWLEFFKDEDKHIFLELLAHYRYYTKEQYKNIMKSFYQKILEKLTTDNDKNSVLFITFSSKKGRASGGDHVRATLEETLIGKFPKDHIISDTDKVEQNIFDDIEYVVFIDDIVGSGATLYNSIKDVCEKFELYNKLNIKIFIAMVYANEKKIQQKKTQLQEKGIVVTELFVHESTGKCFGNERVFNKYMESKYQNIVKMYEEIIEENKLQNDTEFNSVLGFQNGQLLVSFYYNTPNNTLSVFWRPSKVSEPLFIRNKYIRPSIDDIRKNKKHYEKNGYMKRQLENGIKGE